PNVLVQKGKRRIGEIDVLVIFGNRAIVVQAKSKRLTLEARKGNGAQIEDDFKKAVQDSYSQGLSCAKLLESREHEFLLGDGTRIPIPKNLREIYIICTLCDHYPALTIQAREFLHFTREPIIQPPLVIDIFVLDI